MISLKLITKEDPLYVHKFLGIIALLNYTYRYYLLFWYGSMFLSTRWDMFVVALHGCLSVSSLIFHIPQKRHAKLPMIYPEFRLHSIAFGLRSVICCFLNYYYGDGGVGMKILTCFGTMLVADWITKHYAQPGDTTMRAMPYAEKTAEKDRRLVTRFHSHQQVTATLFMLVNMDSAFSPLFAIQLAAFLMTLVRKNIIQPNTWHLVYSWSLMVNVFILKTMTLYQLIIVLIGTYGFRILRMENGMNKYISWAIIFALHVILSSSCLYVELDQYKPTAYNILLLVYLSTNIYNTRALYLS